MENIDEIYEFMKELAKSCGDIVKVAFNNSEKTIQAKDSNVDLVTETDKQVEKVIIESVKSNYPDHKFIGEESTASGIAVEFTDSPTWIIDPVDGTTNFVHGFPYVAVCIGFSINKKVQCSVVFNPILDEMFHAKINSGAFLNQNKISVNQTTSISKSLLLSGFSSSRDASRLEIVRNNLFDVAMNPCRGIRFIGSTACAMCLVARGQGDGYFGAGFHIWDIAASGLIVTEAGGVLRNMKGEKLNLLKRQIIASATLPLANEIASKIFSIELKSD